MECHSGWRLNYFLEFSNVFWIEVFLLLRILDHKFCIWKGIFAEEDF